MPQNRAESCLSETVMSEALAQAASSVQVAATVQDVWCVA